MDSAVEFFRNPLVIWVQQTFHDGKQFSSVDEILDFEFLGRVLTEIDPLTFNMVSLTKGADVDLNVRVQNLVEIVRNMRRFYQEKLQQLLIMKMPDILAIAKEPQQENSLEEIKKFLLIILGCAVQCDNKEVFIEKIKEMDLEMQQLLVPYIQEITDNSEHVMSFRMNELSEYTQDQMATLTEGMYFQFQRLLEERDEYLEAVLDMNLERHEMVAKEAELELVKSPPMSPSRSGSIKTAVVLKANKQKIRDLQNELEERNMQVAEFKEEIINLKATTENVRQENKSLMNEARWVKTYRDEMDVLKSQVDKVTKLESENLKYREKLRELDFYKKRFDELKEQHELLYETKLVLEEQVTSNSTKIERVGHLEEENDRLHAQLKIIMEEREVNQARLKDLMDENAKLQMEKQEGMLEIVSLNQIINGMRERSPDGPNVPLSMEYKESSSTELLRLEKENKHLMKLVESLREGTPRVRELEKEVEALEDKLDDEKTQVARLTEELLNGGGDENILMELAFERSKAGELAGVAESHVNKIQRLQSRLSQKSMRVENLNAELAKKGKGADKSKSSLGSYSEEANNNLLESDEDAGILSSNDFMELKNEIEDKQSKIRKLQKKLKEEEKKSQKISAEVAQKLEEYETMETKVKEHETYGAKVEEQLSQRENHISDLERRFENATTQNKTLNQTIKLNEDKISALEERVSHLMDSASQDTRKVNQTIDQKLKQIRDLHVKLEDLQETAHEHEKLLATTKQKDEKLSSLISSNKVLETQIHEMEIQCEKANGTCKKLDHALKLKNERISTLEASLHEFETASAKQVEDKVVSLKRSLEARSEEVADMEMRMEEMISLNNKLKSSNRAKDDRIQSLEDEISKLEEKSSHSNGEKIEVLTKRLQKKADEIMSLESSLEDVTSNMKKYQRNSEIKEDKIQQLERELQKYEESSQQTEKLSSVIEDKNRRITDLQAEVDEVSAEVRRLEMASKQKEERYLALEKSLLELEDSKADQGKLGRILKGKETKILAQQQSIDEKESRIAELENALDEKESKLKRLNHSLKLKEDQLQTNEDRVSELNELQNQNIKLNNVLTQKDEKILLLEEKIDGMSELQRLHERMKENVRQKEEKIVGLQERLDDMEDVVNVNERLNQQVHQKDERISLLQAKLHDTEDSLHRAEQLRGSLEKNANDQIQGLRLQVDDLLDVKVKRQLSIRRREEKIMTLESRLEDVSSEKIHKESKIQDLQARLEGTMSQFRKLDLSNEEKDEKIREAEARISELQNTYKENRQLSKLLEQAEIKLKEVNQRSEDAETSNERLKESNKELENNLSGLQQRLESTLNLNNKLDHCVKKQEEKLKELEVLLQQEEDRNEEKSDQLLGKERLLTRQKIKIEELEGAIMEREKDLSELESRVSQMSITDDNKSKAAAIVKEKDIIINNLQNKINSIELSATKQESLIVQASKEKDDKMEEFQKKINDLSAEKHKMRLSLQERDGIISDLQRRIEELKLTKTDHDKMNHILNEKNSQLGYLRETIEQYEKDVAHMETRIEGSNSDLNRAKGSIKQKVGRITSLKSQLEEAVSKNHNLASELGLKKEKISSLEKNIKEYQASQLRLKEELNHLATELDELRSRSETETVNVTEKVQLTKRARTELYIKRAPTAHQIYQFETHPANPTKQGIMTDGQVKALEDQIELLQKEKKRVMQQNEEISSKNASLQTENESLRSDLDLLKSDYEVLQEDMNEAKEHYKDLDMSATKIAHRCEVLVQLNSTLEEENRALMDQVNKLLAQNQSLLVKTLESRDTYLEDERAFSDRLYVLERDKEKLMDQVDAANKALLDHANQTKKKNLFVRGAHKVMKKAGLRKGQKKEGGKNNVVLTRMHRSPDNTDMFSDDSNSSFSPSHEWSHQRDGSYDEASLHSSTVTSSFGPIRTALSRSKENLLDAGIGSPIENVVLRRPKSYGLPTDSPSSGSESGDRHARPKSEFIPPSAMYVVPGKRNLHRPHSMEMIANARQADESRTSSIGTNDGDSMSIGTSARKSSVASSRSTGSNPSNAGLQNEATGGGITDYRERAKNSPLQRVRVVKKVLPESPTVRKASRASQDNEEGDIVMYQDAKAIQPRKVSFHSEILQNMNPPHSTPKAETGDKSAEQSGHRSSPLLARSNIFYQPGENNQPNDLPEADQRSQRKTSSGVFYEGENGGTVRNRSEAQAPVPPPYEEASRRQRTVLSQEVVVTPKRDSTSSNKSNEGANARNDKTRNHEETEKKKSAVWYEYGHV